jgi:hypothetical protein
MIEAGPFASFRRTANQAREKVRIMMRSLNTEIGVPANDIAESDQ